MITPMAHDLWLHALVCPSMFCWAVEDGFLLASCASGLRWVTCLVLLLAGCLPLGDLSGIEPFTNRSHVTFGLV